MNLLSQQLSLSYSVHSSFICPRAMSLKDFDLCHFQIAELEAQLHEPCQILEFLRAEVTRSPSSRRRERRPQPAPRVAINPPEVNRLQEQVYLFCNQLQILHIIIWVLRKCFACATYGVVDTSSLFKGTSAGAKSFSGPAVVFRR